MERADNLVGKALQPQTSSQPSSEDLFTKETIKLVFATFKAQYRNFANNRSQQDLALEMSAWHRAFKDVPREKMAEAAERSPSFSPTFAPTLGEFRNILEALRPNPAHQDAPRLEFHGQRTASVAREAVDSLLAKLRGKS